jgi:hypothetical protein
MTRHNSATLCVRCSWSGVNRVSRCPVAFQKNAIFESVQVRRASIVARVSRVPGRCPPCLRPSTWPASRSCGTGHTWACPPAARADTSRRFAAQRHRLRVFTVTTQKSAVRIQYGCTGARAKAWCLSIHAKASLSHSLSTDALRNARYTRRRSAAAGGLTRRARSALEVRCAGEMLRHRLEN